MPRVKRSKRVLQRRVALARECLKRKREGRRDERIPTAGLDTITTTTTTSSTHPSTNLTPPPHHSPEPTPNCAPKKIELEEVCHASQPSNMTMVNDEILLTLKKSYLQEVFACVCCSLCHGKLKASFTSKFMDYGIELECEDCGNKCG